MPVQDPFDFPEPPQGRVARQLRLWATHYYVYRAQHVADGEPLLDARGNPLGPRVSRRDWCGAAMQGTIIVTDDTGRETVYTFDSKPTTGPMQVNCRDLTPKNPEGRIRYHLSRGPFGEGVDPDRDGVRMILVPFRSIAVSPQGSGIAYRSVIFIPAARGRQVTLPSGQTAIHDGYFFAADAGSAIQGLHIDVFGGDSNRNPFPNFITSRDTGTFDAMIIDDPQISTALAQMHDNP